MSKQDRKERRLARQIMDELDITYTQALRQIRSIKADTEPPPPPPPSPRSEE